MPHPCRRSAEPQRLCSLGIAQLLKVSHQQYVAIVFVKLFDGDQKSLLKFAPDRGRSRCQLAGNKLACQIEG